MNWGIWIADMLLKFGPRIFDFVEAIVKGFSNGGTPTEEQWAELRALAAKTSETQMADALGRAGIDPLSEQGKMFMGLVGKTP